MVLFRHPCESLTLLKRKVHSAEQQTQHYRDLSASGMS